MAYIEIQLLSETILGGDVEQKGTVDIDIQVDEFGLPYFSARTLKGVLRDRATWYVNCLPKEKQADYEEALFNLFGKADDRDEHFSNYCALRFGNAKFSNALYEVIKEEKCSPREAMKAITIIRGMTSIDEKTGAAKEGSLRKARMIHSGYTFIAPIYINRSLTEEEKELLTTSVKLLRHIGYMRNRGKGEVSCNIHWKEQENSVSLSKNKLAKYIYLTIDVEEPLKINDVLRTRDSTRALTYIPGHVLRGALVHAYLQDKKPTPNDLDTVNIFNPEKIQFWNGYLMVNGKRSLPFAQHLFETKADSKSKATVKKIYNSLQDNGLEEIESESPVRVNRHMMALDEDGIIGANVEITSSLHININGPDGQRDDALYRYEAIAPKQRFQAIVKAEEAHDFVEWLSQKESFHIWLGGARNSGYGRSRITIQTGDENLEIPNNVGSVNDELYMLATSDWIVYNEQGQLVSSIDDKWLSEQLGTTVKLVGQVVNTELSGGYISHWRAYQPMIRSVKAGSIYRYKVAGSIDETKLNKLIERGIGSRTNEGFGRFIALPNWRYEKLKLSSETSISLQEHRQLSNKDREKEESAQLKRSIIAERIKEDINKEVNTWFSLSKNLEKLNTSQWSKLLEVTNDILNDDRNLQSKYKNKWEVFWEDVKKRTENKSKLSYENIKMAVSEQKRTSIQKFILEDLYEKQWNSSELSKDENLYWSLVALQLFIRKVLRSHSRK